MDKEEAMKRMKFKVRQTQEAGTDSPASVEQTQAGTEETPSPKGDKPWMPVAYVAAKIFLVFFVLWVVFQFVFALVVMDGESMYPRLRDGDLLMAYRLEDTYLQSDVVVYKVGGITHVGRIVAQEGDVVEITADGSLVINGNVQQEEIFYVTLEQIAGVMLPYTVPENSYFVMCDYRTIGTDSRTFGAVSQDDIVGKVITVLRRRGI